MKTSPLAGKPAEPAMLVNVPRLITAYYSETPDPRYQPSGWPLAPQGIEVPHSTRLSTNGISSPSVRPFVSTAKQQRSMARCFWAWTRMRSLCRLCQRA